MSDLNAYLGQLRDCEILFKEKGQDNRQRFREFYSQSRLADFISRPETAMGRHILGTIPKKVYTNSQLDAFRVGSALHAYVFEGEHVWKEDFPLYGSDTRRGSAWEKFKLAVPEAEENRGFTLKKELPLIERVGKTGAVAFKDWCDSMMRSGYEILAVHPEVTFLAEFERVNVGVIVDSLVLVKGVAEGKPFLSWIVWEGKSTFKSVEDTVGLGFSISSFNYDMQAVLYAHVVGEAMKVPTIWRQDFKIAEDAIGEAEYATIGGAVNHLWMDKESGQIGLDLGIVTNPADLNTQPFFRSGSAKVCRALFNLQNMLMRLDQFVSQSQGGAPEDIAKHAPPILHVTAEATRKLDYEVEDILKGMGDVTRPLPGLQQARDYLAIKYPEPPPPAEEKEEEKPTGFKVSFGVPEGKKTGIDFNKRMDAKVVTDRPIEVATSTTKATISPLPATKGRPKGRGRPFMVLIPENVRVGTVFAGQEEFLLSEWIDSASKADFKKREQDYLKMGVELDFSKGRDIRKIRSDVIKQLVENFTPVWPAEGEDDE